MNIFGLRKIKRKYSPRPKKGAVAKSKRLFKPRGFRSSHRPARERDGAGTQNLFGTSDKNGAVAVPKNGHSLNLATRRALVEGASKPSPWVASRAKQVPRKRGAYAARTGTALRALDAPVTRPEDGLGINIELAMSKRAQRQHSQGKSNR